MDEKMLDGFQFLQLVQGGAEKWPRVWLTVCL